MKYINTRDLRMNDKINSADVRVTLIISWKYRSLGSRESVSYQRKSCIRVSKKTASRN